MINFNRYKLHTAIYCKSDNLIYAFLRILHRLGIYLIRTTRNKRIKWTIQIYDLKGANKQAFLYLMDM